MSLFALIAAWAKPLTLGAIVLDLVSVPINLVQIALILRTPSLRQSAFFLLFVVRAVLSLCFFANSYVLYRLPTLNMFYGLYANAPKWALGAVVFLVPFYLIAEYLATLAILANRFSAIALPFRHKRIWRSGPTAVCILAIFLAPVPFSVPFASVDMCVFPPANGSFLVFPCPSTKENPMATLSFEGEVSSILFLVLCFALNTATLTAYKRSPKALSEEAQQSKTVELKLAVYAFVMFLGHLALAGYSISINVLSNAQNVAAVNTVMAFYPLLMAVFGFNLPAWFLLWASSDMRKRVLRLFCADSATTSAVQTLKKWPSAAAGAANGGRGLAKL